MTKEEKLLDELLDIIDNAGDMSRGDLQAVLGAFVKKNC